MNDELIDCYFCDEPYPNVHYMISNYKGTMICNSCEEFCVFSNKNINIINTIDCPVCFENKKGIELPNCSHIICIDCCKSIYFGYNSISNSIIQRPKHYKEQSNSPEFPYDTDEDDGNQKFNKYIEWENKNIDYENENSLAEILQKRDNLKMNRPDWMNEELFIDYENRNILYWVETIKIEKEYDNWIDNKRKNIKNACCPLCRN